MLWFRQLGALMKKNALLKLRGWGSTGAELLLPMLIMAIMVGIRAAITKSDNPVDLHFKLSTPLTPAQLIQAREAGIPIVKNRTFDPDHGPIPWDPDSLAEYFYVGNTAHHIGVQGVNTIQFVPNTDPYVRAMAEAFKVRFPFMASRVETRFASDDDLTSYITSDIYAIDSYNAAIAMAVVINHVGNDWNYLIRGNATQSTIDSTTLETDQRTVNTLQVKYDDTHFTQLMLWGHHTMQDFVESWIIANETGKTFERDYAFQPFPTPPYQVDNFANLVSNVLGLFFTIIYMWPVTRLVKGIVEEKQYRLKEVMRMMGLTDSALYCSWFFTYVIMFALTSLLITLVTYSSVYEKSNKWYIFFFFFTFALATFSFCWLLSVFFSRSQVATTISALLFLGLFFPYFAVEGSSSSSTQKAGACLSAQICFGLGAVVMARLESESTGVNVHTSGVDVDNWSYDSTIGMFIADFFIYLILALYFQQVIPSEYGTNQKWYFLFQPSYWCPAKVDTTQHKSLASSNDKGFISIAPAGNGTSSSAPSSPNSLSTYFETVAPSLQADLGVSIRDLTKVFDDGGKSFTAVKKMNLDLYSGQIFALLGHNGAGKSITINMLSGMIAPTSGDALVYGTSIKENMQGVRKILGVCPQMNVLYDGLTVSEHFYLFAAIKNVPTDSLETTITQLVGEVGLTEKMNEASETLSGGQKRKLQVGLALLGDSKIIFLDEPTSGMDPWSRRATWDLLKRKKDGRVIIFTTHFMDEADQLGDRIAIMAKGEVKCCGSSLFLKNRYGVGYTLTITKMEHKFNEAAVTELINSRIPDVTQLSNIAAEISFRLPFQSSGAFADVFDEFDLNREKYGIENYDISVTTLEEVFLRVGHEEDAHPLAKAEVRKVIEETQKKLGTAVSGQKLIDLVDQPDAIPTIRIDGGEQPLSHTTTNGVSSTTVPSSANDHKAQPPVSSTADTSSTQPASAADPNNSAAVTIHLEPAEPTAPSNIKPVESKSDESKKGAPLLSEPDTSRFDRLRIPDNHVSMFPIHFRALFIKRFINAKRDQKVWTWTILYPFLILFAGCGLITLTVKTTHPQLLFTADNLDQGTLNHIPYVNQAPSTTGINLFQNTSDPLTKFDDTSSVVSPGLSNLNMSYYLLDTLYPTAQYQYSRYNAFYSDFEQAGTDSYVDKFVIFFNTSCQWSASYGLNLYNNQLLHQFAPHVNIQLGIHPFPMTLNQQILTNSVTAIIVAIGFAFIPANFIAYAVREEQDKVKHQQFISGVSAGAYWSANYVWDFINFMVMGLLCLLIFRIWSIPQLIGDNTGAVFVAIVLFGLSVIPFNYLMSFLFTESTSAQNTMLLFYVVSGAILIIAVVILALIDSTKDYVNYIVYVLRIIPTFAFAETIANLIARESATIFGHPLSIWDFDIAGKPLIYMACESFIYFGFVLLYEKVKSTPALMMKLFGNAHPEAKNIPDEDADVINEKARLQSGSGQNELIRIMGLRKVWPARGHSPNKIAVQECWLGIPEGQCFGFLGTNGAGKTTAIKMLTGDIIPDEGSATLNGLDILTHQNEVRRLLGYCPQFDSLIDTLTGREHLTLFARIKGVPEDMISDYIDYLILKIDLQDGIFDKPTKTYSGGNKRKLCVAIALIGNPPIVCLDEPSTGMDPGARRHLWNLIATTMKGRSVILTTHSMEECEALCHRIGIMVDGRFRCLGSTHHVKEVYGEGYQLEVNISESQHAAFQKRLESIWTKVQVIQQHGHSFQFRIPILGTDGTKTTISKVFRLMEKLKSEFSIQEYAASETTLEQIFIHFARQVEEKGKDQSQDHHLEVASPPPPPPPNVTHQPVQVEQAKDNKSPPADAPAGASVPTSVLTPVTTTPPTENDLPDEIEMAPVETI